MTFVRWIGPFVAILALSTSASAYTWHEIPTPAAAYEIAAGDGTSPWIVGTTEDGTTGNYYLYYYNPSNGDWVKATGTGGVGVQIGVAYGDVNRSNWNYPLVVNAAGNIYSGIPSANDISNGTTTLAVTWTESSVSGACATTISSEGAANSVQSNAVPFITGCSSVSGGHDIFYNQNVMDGLDLSDWVQGSGTAEQVSVSQDGSVEIVYDSNNHIWISSFAMFGTWTFQEMPGGANWVSAGAGTSTAIAEELELAWVVGTDSKIFWWQQVTPQKWIEATGGPDGTASRVSVGQNGTVWAVDASHRIWYYN